MGFSGLVCFRKPTLPEKPYFFCLDLAMVLYKLKVFQMITSEIKKASQTVYCPPQGYNIDEQICMQPCLGRKPQK